jgi:hypothetical protein
VYGLTGIGPGYPKLLLAKRIDGCSAKLLVIVSVTAHLSHEMSVIFGLFNSVENIKNQRNSSLVYNMLHV